MFWKIRNIAYPNPHTNFSSYPDTYVNSKNYNKYPGYAGAYRAMNLRIRFRIHIRVYTRFVKFSVSVSWRSRIFHGFQDSPAGRRVFIWLITGRNFWRGILWDQFRPLPMSIFRKNRLGSSKLEPWQKFFTVKIFDFFTHSRKIYSFPYYASVLSLFSSDAVVMEK